MLTITGYILKFDSEINVAGRKIFLPEVAGYQVCKDINMCFKHNNPVYGLAADIPYNNITNYDKCFDIVRAEYSKKSIFIKARVYADKEDVVYNLFRRHVLYFGTHISYTGTYIRDTGMSSNIIIVNNFTLNCIFLTENKKYDESIPVCIKVD